jgi:hypothetical protein
LSTSFSPDTNPFDYLERELNAYNGKHDRSPPVYTLQEWLVKARGMGNAAVGFKAYVHQRLDEAGVPANPEPAKHALSGCRIGDRLDWIIEMAMTDPITLAASAADIAAGRVRDVGEVIASITAAAATNGPPYPTREEVERLASVARTYPKPATTERRQVERLASHNVGRDYDYTEVESFQSIYDRVAVLERRCNMFSTIIAEYFKSGQVDATPEVVEAVIAAVGLEGGRG